MKKITLLLLFLFSYISGYSQLALEGFENTTGPDAFPSTNWTLGTGNWAVFDNGVGSTQSWEINNAVTTPVSVYQGVNAAYVNIENVGAGNTSEEYLATPPVLIPANGVLNFYTRMNTLGNQGTIYQIKVAPATASQTDPFAYSLVQQWTENELIVPTSNFNLYTEKTVDLSAFANQFVYVSFVKIFPQTGTGTGGDTWLIDNVSIDSPCLTPTGLTVSAITSNSASLNWVNPNGTGSASYEIEVVLASGTPTGIPTNTTIAFPYIVTGLIPNTAYKFYVRARCTTGFASPWSVASANFTTLVAPPVCGGNFVDNGGIAGNYLANSNVTTTIDPTTPGDLVTVTFTSFNTESGVDLLKVYDGPNATSPLLATLSGATIPPAITASSATGSLTFVFTSNNTTNNAGWASNVTCGPPPACRIPTAVTASGITINSATLNWIQPANPDSSVASLFDIIVLPANSAAPTAISVPTFNDVIAAGPSFNVTGLASGTCFDIYVRAVCALNSGWNIVGARVCTLVAPPVCGGNYVDTGGTGGDYGNNENLTSVICPVNPGDAVTVTFTAFNTQAGSDILRVYDGNNASGTLLATLSGTTLPPSFTSSAPSGCLTFVFTSNGTTVSSGWLANVTCAPAPACPKPVALTTAGLSPTSVSFGWTPIGSATSWQVIALPCTDPAPTSTTTGWTVTNTNPYPFTGLNTTTCYNFYVRSDCGGLSGLSEWAGPQSFTTAAPGLTCAAPIIVGSLPYTTTDTTANYGDNAPIEGSPGATGCGSTSTYLNGNDVIYSFTSTFTGTINVAMTPTGTWSGIFAYSSCANIGVNCLAGVANSGSTIRTFDLPVTTGSTYYFVISTWPDPQTTGYTLVINRINCVQPTNATVSGISSDSAQASWGNPGAATSWQVAVQPAGTGVPTGSGVVTTTNTNSPLSGLTPLTNYEYYVRADCGDGTFSLWTGPVPFTTAAPPPVCGGNFFDAGGPTANYPNVITDNTTTICPTNPGDVVTVTFTSFETEATWDGLYVFDGNTIGATQIPSANPAGNVNGGLAGSFWGLLTGANLPGPFTASSASGCLTFRFRTDDFGSGQGWSANVTCSPAPNCLRPTTLTATNVTSTSALLGWTEPSPTTVTQWEVLVLPFGSPAPLPSTTGGIIISSNPSLITGLLPGTQYTYYVRGICSTSGTSLWSTGFNFTTLIINDNCDGAIFAPVNGSLQCQQVTPGTIAGATASLTPPIAPCIGTADDDVWFQFIASNTYLNISLLNVVGNTNLNFAVYSGVCGTLTQRYCSAANSLNLVLNNLILGQTYFIRVYSNANTPQTSTFDLCITTPSTCSNSNTICNLLGENTPSTVGITSLGTIGCLFSSPNPTFYTLEVATTGPINLFMSQNALPNGQGAGRDIDYAAWGPFTSQTQACSVVGNQFPFAPPGIGVPVTLTTGCSFSAASTETLNIANAQAGQIYIILITNFSQQPGFINLVQTNFGQPGAGTVNCCPEAFFQYQPSSYCKTPGNPNPIAVITPGSLAGVFSSPFTPGLVFANTATGEIDLMASAPGNYVIVNTIPASGTCQSKERTYTINITEPTSATISYSSPSYCKSVTTLQAVTQTGTTGGSYSAIPNVGLSINPTTGDINPSLSSPGVYTVVYGLPGSICTAGNPSTQVEIIANPNISQPAPVASCYTYTLPSLTLGNYFSQTGGIGPLDITVPITNTQTIYLYVVGAGGCSNEKSFTVTINTVPTPTFTTTASACATATGSVTVTGPIGASAPTPAGLFISEVTDANTGSLTYVELYNGTGSPVNLANYKLRTFNNGSTTFTAGCDNILSGTLNNNSTYVISVGSATNAGGVIPNQVFVGCSGVNTDDCIKLMTLTNTVVDLWGRTDGVNFTPLNQPGYTYRRLNTATVPSTTWNPADWTTLDPEDYANVGSYSLATSSYEYSIDNGVTYQAGLTFNNLAPGNHILIVKDLITGCLSAPVTIVIDTLNPTPSVTTFTYVTPVCQNATSNPIPNTSATGFTTGGTFSEYLTTGLVFINTSTGEIDLANSTPGSHTIRYSVALNSTTCIAAGFTDFPIVINPVVNPTFSFGTTLSICSGGIVPTLPNSSNNSITGTWSPAIVDNANSGTYTFTPDAGQCANTTTFTVTITPQTTPTFTFGTTLSICSGGIVPTLPTSSSNSITGSWSPTIVDNVNNGTYTFTPDAGQCANTTTFTVTITPQTTPTFTFGTTLSICSGGIVPTLPTSSSNSITGTWSPAIVDNANNGTYTFTPDAGQCANTTTFTVTITPQTTPTFTFGTTLSICSGGIVPTLTTSSSNSITGSWSPAIVDNANNGTYTFTPNAGQCANTTTFIVTITPQTTPTFSFGTTLSICSGGIIPTLPTSSSNFITGSWSPDIVDNDNNGTYTFTPDAGQCATTTTLSVTVTPRTTPTFSFGTSLTICSGDAVPTLPNESSNSINGTWSPAVVNTLNSGTYTFTPGTSECAVPTTFTVSVTPCQIQKGISVNNDGLNDTFDLSGFDVKKLTIFNRLGMKVYSRNNYVDEWGGKSDDGDELPDGTYYYVIEQRSGTVKTGWIYINRAQ